MTKVTKQMHIMLKSFSGPDTMKTAYLCFISSLKKSSIIFSFKVETYFWNNVLWWNTGELFECSLVMYMMGAEEWVSVRTAEQTQEAFRSQEINCLDVFVHSAPFLTCTSSFMLLWKLTLHFLSPEIKQTLRTDVSAAATVSVVSPRKKNFGWRSSGKM